jgi:hypothetical protein
VMNTFIKRAAHWRKTTAHQAVHEAGQQGVNSQQVQGQHPAPNVLS